ncbi:PAS domain-containing protein [Novosphingobium sp. FSY-8]|uniref:PAS domain-containing protein n=1 Tax=Novosphingobium ovatum TaxID=1908523 RepID=A0ABW9XFU1_9SPHN|nr:methyl-accepting chemotaxis protein [Novosphingobium ovatum]NBC37400.1 PAS domain-containing protein [Novosphingobium ovatum]
MFWRKNHEPSLDSLVAQAVFESSPDGMLLIQDGVFTACNRACEALYDHPRSQIIGRTPADFSAPTQSDGRPTAVHVPERLQEAMAKGFSRFEWLNLNRRGEVVRILVTLIPTHIHGNGEVLVLIQSLAETAGVIEELRHGLDQLSAGNLTCHLTRPFRADYEGLRDAFNTAVDAFAGSMGKVMQTAQMVSNGAEEIQQAAQDLSNRTEQQAAKLESTASQLSEIGHAMEDSVSAATSANTLVAETRRRAQESGAVVTRAVDAMAAIEASSREISNIISVIDGIAFQTNLLALNAGVEAARAGDAGRGFAVVASEVRALAQRSADAAKDIKTRIEGSTRHVSSGVALVTETGSTLSRIAEGITQVSDVISQIAQDITERTNGLRQANAMVGDINRLTQSNAAMSEQASAAARGLATQSATLMDELQRFRMSGSMTQRGGGGITYASASVAPEQVVPFASRRAGRRAA